jgi:TolB-like protein/DNA-binding winged helix-turn-helix (wHTH) protein
MDELGAAIVSLFAMYSRCISGSTALFAQKLILEVHKRLNRIPRVSVNTWEICMDTVPSSGDRFRFDEFEVDVCLRRLSKGDERIRLQEQPFQVLLALLQRQGELVTREELRGAIWAKGTFIDFDHGLNTAIKKIRAALGDSANLPRYVETIPRRGYRFLAPVERVSAGGCDHVVSSNVLPSRTQQPVVPDRLRRRQVAAIFAIALITVCSGYVYRLWSTHRTHAGKRIVVVVLPFENISGDPAQDYLGEGISEELTTQLGRVDPKRLVVVGRVTAAAYARNKTVAEIGRELHVDYVLEGSVRRDERRLRVSAQLIRVRDQGQVWANEFDREFGSVLTVQSEIADVIAEQVQSSIASS